MSTDGGLRLLPKDDGVVFEVRVAPRASREKIVGVHDGALKVALTAAPVDGAANAALIKLLAKRLGIAKGAVEIVHGAHARTKTLHARGVSREAVRAALLSAAPRHAR